MTMLIGGGFGEGMPDETDLDAIKKAARLGGEPEAKAEKKAIRVEGKPRGISVGGVATGGLGGGIPGDPGMGMAAGTVDTATPGTPPAGRMTIGGSTVADFGTGAQAAMSPTGSSAYIGPTGTNAAASRYGASAGSRNAGDILDAYRQLKTMIPRNVGNWTATTQWNPELKMFQQVWNPGNIEDDAQHSARVLGMVKDTMAGASQNEKDALARTLGMGNLGVNQGTLEVAQRTQQESEARGKHERSKSNILDKFITAVGLIPGMEAATAKRLIDSAREELGIGSEGVPGPSQPFDIRPGQSPAGRVTVAGGYGGTTPEGGAPPGTKPPKVVVAKAKDWTKLLGMDAYEAGQGVAKPDPKGPGGRGDVGSFLSAIRSRIGDQQMGEKMPDILEWAAGHYGSRSIGEFVNTTEGFNRLKNYFVNPSEVENTRSALRDYLTKMREHPKVGPRLKQWGPVKSRFWDRVDQTAADPNKLGGMPGGFMAPAKYAGATAVELLNHWFGGG